MERRDVLVREPVERLGPRRGDRGGAATDAPAAAQRLVRLDPRPREVAVRVQRGVGQQGPRLVHRRRQVAQRLGDPARVHLVEVVGHRAQQRDRLGAGERGDRHRRGEVAPVRVAGRGHDVPRATGQQPAQRRRVLGAAEHRQPPVLRAQGTG
ncbi:hypothetical protein LZG04_09165 [Saccharothrix sp. S26]|uniref:hypothetical protein n=1 Tax=Saccharothrix sp. S26 TaxID=2907215 RepID=UPI001F47EB1D|nr:hypothetical protein [Saccharothrix sp. S26]MCE6994975.1 hypothetical protein [Saccharothrix sp. S26]